jgi:O-antigen/teichoic acid export membrane protein
MTLYQSTGSGVPSGDQIRELRWRTMYEAASASRPRNRLTRVVRRDGDLLSNAGSLMGSTIVTAATGFVYWWVAARAFSTEAVGAASAAVSAMTLIGTLGMFGMGTLLISRLPRMDRDQWQLINTCLMVTGSIATIGGLIYVCLAEFVIVGLRESLNSPSMVALLLLGITLNAVALVLDEGLIGLLAGGLQMMRNMYFAVGKLVLLIILGLLPVTFGGNAILATWLVGTAMSMLLLAAQLRRQGMQVLARPRLAALRGLVGHAWDYNLLNLATMLPRTMLPLVVTAVLGTRNAAPFYTAWMVANFVVMVPNNLSVTLFAVAAGDTATLRTKVRTALLVSLGLGVPASLVLAVGSGPIMMIFGAGYAKVASDALMILALTYTPTVFRQLYLAVSRVHGRVRRATGLAAAAGVVEVAAAWWGGVHGGTLTTLVLWLAVVITLEALVTVPVVLKVVLAKPKPTESASRRPVGAGPSRSPHRVLCRQRGPAPLSTTVLPGRSSAHEAQGRRTPALRLSAKDR